MLPYPSAMMLELQPSSGKRYWRLLFPSGGNDATNHRLGLCEVEFHETVGGANALTTDPSSLFSASKSAVTGSFTSRQAVDGTTTGFNGALSADNDDVNWWWSWDFGTAKTIVEIVIIAMGGFAGASDSGPKEITVQSSPDNTVWTTEWTVAGGPYTWTSNQSRTFP